MAHPTWPLRYSRRLAPLPAPPLPPLSSLGMCSSLRSPHLLATTSDDGVAAPTPQCPQQTVGAEPAPPNHAELCPSSVLVRVAFGSEAIGWSAGGGWWGLVGARPMVVR